MFYWFAKGIFWIFFTLFCRWKVYGRKNLPSQGPVVLVANHISLWDPVVAGVALRRRVYFMAKQELFDMPVVGQVIRALGAFPVKRGQADFSATRRALALLRQGEVVGIFPEGGRQFGSTGNFHPGAALLAVKTGAPIVPVALKGTDRILAGGIPHSFEVHIGPPLVLPPRKDIQLHEISREAQKAVIRLLGE